LIKRDDLDSYSATFKPAKKVRISNSVHCQGIPLALTVVSSCGFKSSRLEAKSGC